MQKICSTCKNSVDTALFSPDKRAADGLQARCRQCSAECKLAAYKKNPEKHRTAQNAYYHLNKKRISALNKKSRTKNIEKIRAHKKEAYLKIKDDPAYLEKRDDYARKHKAKKAEYDRLYREKNAKKLEETKAAWRLENKDLIKAIKSSYKARRRTTEKNGDSSRSIQNWLSQQNRICRWCFEDCSAKFHIDHVRPLSKGGTHTIDNLCIACPTCNLRKNARDPVEFENWMRSRRQSKPGEIERHRVDVGMLTGG